MQLLRYIESPLNTANLEAEKKQCKNSVTAKIAIISVSQLVETDHAEECVVDPGANTSEET